MEEPQVEPLSKPTQESGDDEFFMLSDKYYFASTLTKSHVKSSYHMGVPLKMFSLLPNATIPAVLTYQNKDWKLLYHGENPKNKRFGVGWRDFVTDNDLKIGDACVFELRECGNEKLKFRVQILRGDFPDELLARICGTYVSPIDIE
ncbi:B3 DNA binding domain [Dillenia turbinata]|uniref:B3 DNA binding domain n=1 Tax=Dillenia turbinata TaxID=194707 RepID=A0AAN8UV84_9MAGN